MSQKDNAARSMGGSRNTVEEIQRQAQPLVDRALRGLEEDRKAFGVD
jgi:hypothetical protein